MNFELRKSLRANEDVDSAVAWLIQHRSPDVASDWLDQVHEAFESLQVDPTRYPPAYEAIDLGRELREIHFGRRSSVYRIVFEIRGNLVHILRIRHSAQDNLSDDDLARGLSG